MHDISSTKVFVMYKTELYLTMTFINLERMVSRITAWGV